MTKSSSGQTSSVRAFVLLVDLAWIFVVVGVVLAFVLAVVNVVSPSRPADERFAFTFGMTLSMLLISAIYVWMVFHLRQLMRSVKDNRPFDPANPQRIQKIGYAVFLLIPAEILDKFLMMGDKAVSAEFFMDLVWGGFFKWLFLGFGVLVIAKVFERGVSIQRDQSLTI